MILVSVSYVGGIAAERVWLTISEFTWCVASVRFAPRQHYKPYPEYGIFILTVVLTYVQIHIYFFHFVPHKVRGASLLQLSFNPMHIITTAWHFFSRFPAPGTPSWGWQCPDFACRQCPLFRAPFLNCYFLSLWFFVFAFVLILLIRWLTVVTVASRQWHWCCGQWWCKSKLCNESKVWKCLIIAQWG